MSQASTCAANCSTCLPACYGGGRRGISPGYGRWHRRPHFGGKRLLFAQRVGPVGRRDREGGIWRGRRAAVARFSFGYALDLNGAARRTHYSTTGSVTTWKAGLVYEPVEGVRLRGTRSRDIRAPNIFELFGPQTLRSIGLSDPLNGGLQTNPFVITGSNPNLSVEKADSWTGGFVIAPRSGPFQRLRLSVDYYNIKVADAIGALGAQTLVNRCAQGPPISAAR
ncbi:TonB-dependent receptor domain-containing protein [Sphingobium xenophagum]|nr:TonB-dependent receptor [Sphingobium xenophagum]